MAETSENIEFSNYTESVKWKVDAGGDSASGFHKITPPRVYGMTQKQIEEYIPGLFRSNICRYCKSGLSKRLDREQRFDGGVRYGHAIYLSFTQTALVCPSCGWWVLFGDRDDIDGENYATDSLLFEGILKRFELTDKEVPMNELRKYLRRNITGIRHINPTAFERLICDVYRDFYDCEARHVGGPGDNGVDVFAVINDEPHLIQAKRRGRLGHIESAALVRELVGTVILNDARKGHLVTSAAGFSKQAISLSQSKALKRFQIEIQLKSRDDIYNMIRISDRKLEDMWETHLRVLQKFQESFGDSLEGSAWRKGN